MRPECVEIEEANVQCEFSPDTARTYIRNASDKEIHVFLYNDNFQASYINLFPNESNYFTEDDAMFGLVPAIQGYRGIFNYDVLLEKSLRLAGRLCAELDREDT